MSRLLPYILLVIGSILPCLSWSQYYNFKSFTVKEGLPQNHVPCLIQDQRGFLWCGTQGAGLSRFDGINFVNYKLENGLPSNTIQSLLNDQYGRLWIGTDRGLCRFNGLAFKNIKTRENNPLSILSLIESNDGMLWVGTQTGLYKLACDSLLKASSQKLPIYDLELDSTGTLWAGTSAGIWKISGQDITVIDRSNGLKSNLINDLLVDESGKVWVATQGQGLQAIVDNHVVSIPETAGTVFTKLIAFNGQIWMATRKSGIAIYHPENGTIGWKKELPSKYILDLTLDDQDNIWVGSTGGIAVQSTQPFRIFNAKSGTGGVTAVHEDAKGNMWVGHQSGWLRILELESGELHPLDTLDLGKTITVLQPDPVGNMWVGTNRGIAIFPPDSLHRPIWLDDLRNTRITDILHLNNTFTYLASTDGIYLISNKSGKEEGISVQDLININDGLPDNRISDLCLDKYGRLWFATRGSGVGMLDANGNILNFGNDVGLNTSGINNITEDAFGWLWIGSRNGGMYRINTNDSIWAIKPFSLPHSASSCNVLSLVFDASHNGWVCTETGIVKLVLDAQRELVESVEFGVDDGVSIGRAHANSAYLDHSGQLWFGGTAGAALTDPSNNLKNAVPPKTHINTINLFYRPIQDSRLRCFVSDWGQVKDEILLTYTQNHLSFSFVGIDLNHPKKVRYQWMLEGSETQWSPWGGQTTTTYSNLPPGSYMFRLRSKNSDGVLTSNEEQVAFTILAPFWQKSWFAWGSWGSGIALLLIIFWVVLRSVKRKAKLRAARLKLEKNVVELEQKALRLQMNPHFIFNTLNSIQGLIATQDSKTARLYLSKFSKLMRTTLENSREALIPVEEEVESLRYYLDLERFSNDNKFDYSIEIDEEAGQFMLPPLLVQPFAENAIIHGLIPRGKGGKLTIGFKVLKGRLVVKIHDNGVGRKKAEESKAQQSNAHKSTGLQVTQERLDIINGAHSKSIEFVDLYENDLAVGTLVKLTVKENAE